LILKKTYCSITLNLRINRSIFNFSLPTESEKTENLPSTGFNPPGIRMNYFLGDKIILCSYYRYYVDDWGIKAPTASLEVPYKISPFLSISKGFFRGNVNQFHRNTFAKPAESDSNANKCARKRPACHELFFGNYS